MAAATSFFNRPLDQDDQTLAQLLGPGPQGPWVPLAGAPPGLALPTPTARASDPSAIYAQATVGLPDGRVCGLVRTFPRADRGQRHRDRYYLSGVGQAPRGVPEATLGDAPSGSLGAASLVPPAGAFVPCPLPGGSWQQVPALSLPQGAAMQPPVRVLTDGSGTYQRSVMVTPSGAWMLIRRWSPRAGGGVTPTNFYYACSLAQRRATSTLGDAPARSRVVPYAATADHPYPPSGPGWFETEATDPTARRHASGLLGELPTGMYTDVLTRTGLYRFFAFPTGAGTKSIGALRFWGVGPDRGAGTVGDVASDVQTYAGQVGLGDLAVTNSDWSGAVQAYQQSGNYGAQTLGPDIDTQTAGASKPLTQQAWAINGNLQAINASGSTQADATNAQGLARQMANLYAQANSTPPPGISAPAANAPLAQAATALASYLTTNGCTQDAIPACTTFQSAWNASGLGGQLTVDGKYGPQTQAALAQALSGTGTSAPASCFPAGSTAGGSAPSTNTSTPTTSQAGISGGTIALGALGVATVAGIIWAAATGHLPSNLLGHHSAHAPSSGGGRRLYAERVRLDRGGYDSSGRYWGTGQALYRVSTDDSEIDEYVRADSAAAAKAKVKKGERDL
jgi:hypothetical protein